MKRRKRIAGAVVLAAAIVCHCLDASETTHLQNIRQITFDGSRSGEAYFSRDGRQIVFQSTRPPAHPHEEENPFYQIFTLDLRGGALRRISGGVGKTTCAFFRPDGRRVLFASTYLDPEALKKQREEIEFLKSGQQRRYQWDFDEHYDIFDAKPDGSDLRRLTDAAGYDAEASYSPDGKRICFTSNRDGDREIYVMDADGGNPRRITNDVGYDGGPFFSPDGQWIVYRHFTPDDKQAEVMMISRHGEKRQLTNLGAMSWSPFFHPSGKWIVFCSNKDGGFANFELYLVRPDGSDLTRLTFTDGFDGLPVFSPDGRKLLWTSTRVGGKSQLFIADFVAPGAKSVVAPKPPRSAFNVARLWRDIEFLASPELEGRRTASAGEQKAAQFLEQELRRAGLREVAKQPFTFQSGVGLGIQNHLEFTIARDEGDVNIFRGKVNEDFQPLSLSANGDIEGEIVFVGYGIATENYDSFGGLDVKDKIVLALRFQPEAAPDREKERLRQFAPLRHKAMLARERGAKALLVFSGPNSLPEDQFIGMRGDGSFADSGIVAAQISRALAEKLFAAAGKNLQQTQATLDKLETQTGFALPVRARVRVELKRETAQGHNVSARLPAAARDRTEEVIVIGAHYDHLGRGSENSLAEQPDALHLGADDNASGTAGILELARHFAPRARELRRDILFVCFSGEEMGLLGSNAFLDNPPVPPQKIVAMLNMDMIGRLHERQLSVQGAGSSPLWPRLVEQHALALPLRLTLSHDPYLPTDSAAFYQREIPTLNFFTGSHADYHRPSDTADKINYAGEAEVLDLIRRIAADLASRSDPPRYARVTERTEGVREGLRAYLGTIPDYAADIRGVRLSGVRAGSPAEKAGLKTGDVIIRFAGKQIVNIYDYTYALGGVKIGQPVEITIQRNGKELTIAVVPEQRK